MLIGATRTGKTEWARSLGDHFYCCGQFNADDVDTSRRYAVFDDIEITNKTWCYWKSWFGAQKQFTITDKYRHKRSIKWGKPMIFVCNPRFDPRRIEGLGYDELQWLEGNCIFVELDRPMYQEE